MTYVYGGGIGLFVEFQRIPVVGEEVLLEGTIYRVSKVRHVIRVAENGDKTVSVLVLLEG